MSVSFPNRPVGSCFFVFHATGFLEFSLLPPSQTKKTKRLFAYLEFPPPHLPKEKKNGCLLTCTYLEFPSPPPPSQERNNKEKAKPNRFGSNGRGFSACCSPWPTWRTAPSCWCRRGTCALPSAPGRTWAPGPERVGSCQWFLVSVW